MTPRSVDALRIFEPLLLGRELLATMVLVSLHLTNYTFMLKLLRLPLRLPQPIYLRFRPTSRNRIRFLTSIIVLLKLFSKYLLLYGALTKAKERVGINLFGLNWPFKYLVMARFLQGTLCVWTFLVPGGINHTKFFQIFG